MNLKLKAPICPCCHGKMRDIPAHNALSRFHPVYICSFCGINEALFGNYWDFIYKANKERIEAVNKTWTMEHKKEAT